MAPTLAAGQPLGKPLEKCRLRWVELLARGVEVEPLGPVHLGERLPGARARRPLHLERVARDGDRVEVALDGPGGHLLAALLLHAAQIGQLTRRKLGPGLLRELTAGARLGVLAVLVLALGDGPGGLVLVRPERAAGVHQ